jgi:hypothetical protein
MSVALVVGVVVAIASCATASRASPFTGTWHVHDGQLVIRSDHTGEQQNLGGCDRPCLERDRLRWNLSDGGTRLTAVITAVTFTDRQTGAALSDPHADDQQRPGDAFSLRLVAPHLAKSTYLRTSLQASDIGNPYWCGAGLAESLQSRCGA